MVNKLGGHLNKLLIYTLTIGIMTFAFHGKAMAFSNVSSIVPDNVVEQANIHEVRKKVKRYKKKKGDPKQIHQYDYRNFKYKRFKRQQYQRGKRR